LTDFQSWKEGESGEVTLLDYAAYTATPDQLFGYAAVFFREVMEVDGHHYFVDAFDEKAYALLKARFPDGRDIQRALNALPMSRLLQDADIGDGAAVACAQLVASAWTEVHIRKGVTAEVHGTTLEDLSVTLVNLHE
jgi:hypothetical protein